MSIESGSSGRKSAGAAPASNSGSIPSAPPLPAPRPFQRARDAANRIFRYQSRPLDAHENDADMLRFTRGSISVRHASIGAGEDATASHRTGLAINTIAINERGTHALLGGKEIFKTVRVENGEDGVKCVEELNLKTAIKSTPTNASGAPRSIYSIDIADVAWAKGDCGDYVAAATSSGKIILYDLGHAGLPAAQLYEHSRQVHKVTFNPHRGNLLLSGSQDGTVRLWDLRDVRQEASKMQSRRKYSGQSDGVRDVKWSLTDGVDFAFGTDGGWIQRWDIRNLKQAKVRVAGHTQTCNTVDWHPDGKHLLSASADRTVKVWDFSNSKTRQALWEIQTPYPVLNARWRPSCESHMPGDHGARLCTQFATSYDREQPVVHVWDFRRPALPFRELALHQGAPTDLLWHSQDLLWTVGLEGTFWQADIQHSKKVINKRNLQCVALSSRGEVSLVVQKRRQHKSPRKLPPSMFDAKRLGQSLGASPDDSFLSRSWADDGLDQSFLSALSTSKRRSRSSSQPRAPSVSSGPLSREQPVTLKLDEVLVNRKSFRPSQVAHVGSLPVLTPAAMIANLAQMNILPSVPHQRHGIMLRLERGIEENVKSYHAIGWYKQSQMWQLVGFVAKDVLRRRVERSKISGYDGASEAATIAPTNIARVATRLLSNPPKSSVESPATMRPISALSQQLVAPESSSNQPTPQARPFRHPLPDVDDGDHLDLPPPQGQARENGDPCAVRRLTSGNLHLHKLQGSHDGSGRNDMMQKWNAAQRRPTLIDSSQANGIGRIPVLEKQDSQESFQFLSESTDSKDPSSPSSLASLEFGVADMRATGLVQQHQSALRPFVTHQVGGHRQAKGGEDPEHRDLLLASQDPELPRSHLPTQSQNKDGRRARLHQIQRNGKPSGSMPHESSARFPYLPVENETDYEEGRPFTLIALLEELLEYYTQHVPNAQVLASLCLLIGPILPRTHPLPIDHAERVTAAYIDAFTSVVHRDEELGDLLQMTLGHSIDAGLNPLQIESIISAYHEQLIQLHCSVEASVLRRLAYPGYPSVYEDAVKDNFVPIKCGSCNKPLDHGLGALRCGRCREKQLRCAVCWSDRSPFPAGFSSDGGGKQARQAGVSAILSICLLCGHGGHSACMQEWFQTSGAGDGGCVAEGCLCDCTSGSWRKTKNQLLSRQRRARGQVTVRVDDWKVMESKAAQRAAAVLQKSVARHSG